MLNYPLNMQGEIRRLKFKKPFADGWVAREIVVKQVDGHKYPEIRDTIILVGSNGWELPEVPFTKWAGRNGWVLIGRTGQLRPWFKLHYPLESVESDKVFLELVEGGAPPKYRILASKEQLRPNL